MARIYTAGFEWHQGGSAGLIEPQEHGGGGGGDDATNAYDGGWAAKSDSGAGNGNTYRQAFVPTSVLSTTYYAQVRFKFAQLPGSRVQIMYPQDGSGNRFSVRLDNLGALTLWDETGGTAQIGSAASVTIATGVYYRIAMSVVMNASNQQATATLQLDGVQAASGNAAAASNSITNWIFGWLNAPGANAVLYTDDVIIQDSTGSSNNSWPADEKVALLLPVSDNARVGFLEGAGGTTNLFNDVKNKPPAGAATPASNTQVKDTAANTTDTYDVNIASYTSAGVTGTVTAVTLVADHAYSAASAATLGLQGISNPAVTEVTGVTNGSAIGAWPTNWATLRSSLDSPTVTLGTQPVVRVRHGTSHATNVQSVDAIGIYVSYIPPAVIPQAPHMYLARTAANF